VLVEKRDVMSRGDDFTGSFGSGTRWGKPVTCE
jgi:hypothetical protein